ncbi:MAG: hypothetical protein K0U98_26610 [Deltaproteobacteria bacterium]|nr:hypothetical protein [Deltaproteobacteria bacterium]
MSRKRRFFFAGLLFLHILPFAVRPALIGGDEPHYALMAHSMAVDGDIDLENNYQAVEQGSFAAGRKRAGEKLERHLLPFGERQVLSHPLGLPWLAAPLLWLQQVLAPGAAPDLLLGLLSLGLTFAALLAGRDLLTGHLQDQRRANLVTFSLYFSTPIWYYSRTFFTEPYLWALPVLGLWLMGRQRWLASGILLGMTFLIKEIAVLILLPLLLGVLLHRGVKRCAQASVGLATAVAVYAFKNYAVYGEPWVSAYPFQVGDPVAGAVGLLLSFTFGLLPFAPLAVVALVGYWPGSATRNWQGNPATLFLALSLVIFASYFGLTACWIDPTGGSSFGTRLLLPVLPALALPLARLWQEASSRRWLRLLLLGTTIAGFAIQWSAALDPVPAMWSIRLSELLSENLLAAPIGALLAAVFLVRVLKDEEDGSGRRFTVGI